MKKTKKAKKLQFEKLTVRKLITSELVGVRGGVLYQDGGGGGGCTDTTDCTNCTYGDSQYSVSTKACQAGSGL